MYPEFLGRISAVLIFIGFNLTFFPQFVLGYLGMPRRYHAYPPEFQVLNVMSTAGASILGVGYLMPLVYLIWSLRYGAVRRTEPVGRHGAGVADAVAAADGQLRRDAGGDARGVRLRRAENGGDALSERAPPALAHHFDDLDQQREASALGMWVFLVTEIMFFGGLFTAYAVYTARYPQAFHDGEPPPRRAPGRRSTPSC